VSGLTLAVAAGCDVDDLRAPATASSTGPATTAPEPSEEADRALVDDVVAAIAGVRTQVAAATDPALSTLTTSLVSLHDAHLGMLSSDGSSTPSASATPPAPPDRAQVRRAESGLQGRLATAAGRAGNAELAQLLASMSAAVAQQVELLAGSVR